MPKTKWCDNKKNHAPHKWYDHPEWVYCPGYDIPTQR